jgi:hypothetical protein
VLWQDGGQKGLGRVISEGTVAEVPQQQFRENVDVGVAGIEVGGNGIPITNPSCFRFF